MSCRYQVDIALECARLQHRFSLPPLEVQDYSFPASDSRILPYNANVFHGNTSHHHQPDIVQEILSVAQASQHLQNQETSSLAGNYAPADDDFSFLLHGPDTMNYSRCLDNIGEELINHRSIEIRDHNDQVFQTGRMVENLRWIGMSNKELETVITHSDLSHNLSLSSSFSL